jgi:hypothetical protein
MSVYVHTYAHIARKKCIWGFGSLDELYAACSYPLTLTLSPKEREFAPSLPQRLLSHGERIEVRG